MSTLQAANGTLTTVGAGTLTAALLCGQNITRTGPTGAFADTFDTAANIVAALSASSSGFGGAQWYVTYYNDTVYTATLTAPGGGNFTLNGASAAVPANSIAELLIVVTVAGAVTVTVLYRATAT
jgi:hypothetical protein